MNDNIPKVIDENGKIESILSHMITNIILGWHFLQSIIPKIKNPS